MRRFLLDEGVALGVTSPAFDYWRRISITSEIIERDTEWYAGPRRRFVLCDLVDDPLPKADLILCRDCLVHLPYAETRRAIDNFRRSGAIWLLTTTFTGDRTNHDIAIGDWRPINLERAPYGFPRPVEVINEESDEVDEELGAFPDKSLALWRLADLPANIRYNLVEVNRLIESHAAMKGAPQGKQGLSHITRSTGVTLCAA